MLWTVVVLAAFSFQSEILGIFEVIAGRRLETSTGEWAQVLEPASQSYRLYIAVAEDGSGRGEYVSSVRMFSGGTNPMHDLTVRNGTAEYRVLRGSAESPLRIRKPLTSELLSEWMEANGVTTDDAQRTAEVREFYGILHNAARGISPGRQAVDMRHFKSADVGVAGRPTAWLVAVLVTAAVLGWLLGAIALLRAMRSTRRRWRSHRSRSIETAMHAADRDDV